jgi:phosphatidylethanolamine/phosphatidyl-N-methylethanolamine N-methyltransferase
MLMAAPHSSTIYHNLSRFYDSLFAPFFRKRIHTTIAGLKMPPGSRVLEVGVGTGLSLEAYPKHVEVVGIDLSNNMLDQARRKIDRHGWRHIALKQMDALNLDFPDEAFDYVMAFHIASVVPNCSRLMQEIARVARPNGTIVVINHLRSERRWVARLVDLLSPATNRLGWHTQLTFEDVVRPAPLQDVRRFKTSPQSLFTVVIAKKPANLPAREADPSRQEASP